jgi:cytochrome c5
VRQTAPLFECTLASTKGAASGACDKQLRCLEARLHDNSSISSASCAVSHRIESTTFTVYGASCAVLHRTTGSLGIDEYTSPAAWGVRQTASLFD